jgi:hypothetical protein
VYDLPKLFKSLESGDADTVRALIAGAIQPGVAADT